MTPTDIAASERQSIDEYNTGAFRENLKRIGDNAYDKLMSEHAKLDTSATARQYDTEQLEEERDELLLMLANQVRISAKLAERAEHWHNQYLELRKKHE